MVLLVPRVWWAWFPVGALLCLIEFMTAILIISIFIHKFIEQPITEQMHVPRETAVS